MNKKQWKLTYHKYRITRREVEDPSDVKFPLPSPLPSPSPYQIRHQNIVFNVDTGNFFSVKEWNGDIVDKDWDNEVLQNRWRGRYLLIGSAFL